MLMLGDGAAVELPVGAVDAPTELNAQPVPPSDVATDGWQIIGPVVDLTLGRTLREPATLRLENDAVAENLEAAQVFAATFDDDDQEWVVLSTEATTDGWTATTSHFSVFGWFTDASDWAVGAWADLQGRRASEPSCQGGPPDWSDSVYLSERNSPLRVCVDHDPADDHQLVVKVVNNRGYGMLVDVPSAAVWVWQRGLPGVAQSAMSDYLGTIFGVIDASATRLHYLPPGDEIHIGLDYDAVAAMGHHAVIDLPTQVSIALITTVQSLISQAVGIVGDDGWVGAIVAAQAIAACVEAGFDIASQTDAMAGGRLLQTCLVDNFGAIVDKISGGPEWRSLDSVQGVDRLGGTAWGRRAARLLRGTHIVGALDTLGFLGELVSDSRLSAAAKQVNVYAQIQGPPAASTLTASPQGLGPLRLGMSPDEARATRMVRWDSGACSADLYGMDYGRWVSAAVYETDEGRSEFFVGPAGADGPTVIDRIDVFGSSPATSGGIRVGSTFEDLRRVHGSDLREPPLPDWAMSRVLVWERNGMALVFEGGADESGTERVWYMIIREAADEYYPIAFTDDIAGAC